MVFHGDIAIALTLIALGVGYLVMVKAGKEENSGSRTIGLIIGWIVIVVAAITFLCASYYTVRYWDDGYYESPRPMMMEGRNLMNSGKMMPGMMGGHGMRDGMPDKNCQHEGGMRDHCNKLQKDQCRQKMHDKMGMSGKMTPGMHHPGGGGMMPGMQNPDSTNQ